VLPTIDSATVIAGMSGIDGEPSSRRELVVVPV